MPKIISVPIYLSFFLSTNIKPETSNAAAIVPLRTYISQRISSKSFISEATETPVRKYLETSMR